LGHKKRKTKYFTFLLIPDDEKETKSIKISAFLLRLFLVFFALAFVLFLVGTATYWNVAEMALDYGNLFEENIQLKQMLGQVEQLQTDLEKIKQFDQKFRSSISGYVKIVENDQNKSENAFADQLFSLEDEKVERSIFNSIPDIYPADGFVTRGFESNSMKKDTHLGLDIAGSKGAPIRATADGVVIFSGWTYEEGYIIILKHKFDFYSFYKHNMQNLCNELEFVKKGQVIALLGDSGEISSGAHLHFEIWRDNKPVNPERFLRGTQKHN